MVKLSVLGTSNSLQKDGYTSHLVRENGISDLLNRSLGVSTSHLCALYATPSTFVGRNGCILDFAVNEEVFERSLPSVTPDMSNALKFAVAQALEAGCLPVALLLPRRSISGSQ